MANDDVKDALETMATKQTTGSAAAVSMDVALEAIQAIQEGGLLTALEAVQAAQEAIQAVSEASRRPSGLPADAVPIHGASTVITEAVAVEIIAAPSALLALFISQVIINNKTIAEDPVITVQDDAGSPVPICSVLPSTAGGNGGNAIFTFDPPVELTANQALDGIADASVGDVIIHASGWVGTATV